MLRPKANTTYIYARTLGVPEHIVRKLGGAAYLKSLDSDARNTLLNESKRLIESTKKHVKPSVTRSLKQTDPTPQEKQAARVHARTRANGRCQLRIAKECPQEKTLPLNGDLWTRGHLHHGFGKRRFGWHESAVTGQYHLWVCFWCHNYEHAGRKPCPPKPRVA